MPSMLNSAFVIEIKKASRVAFKNGQAPLGRSMKRDLF